MHTIYSSGRFYCDVFPFPFVSIYTHQIDTRNTMLTIYLRVVLIIVLPLILMFVKSLVTSTQFSLLFRMQKSHPFRPVCLAIALQQREMLLWQNISSAFSLESVFTTRSERKSHQSRLFVSNKEYLYIMASNKEQHLLALVTLSIVQQEDRSTGKYSAHCAQMMERFFYCRPSKMGQVVTR